MKGIRSKYSTSTKNKFNRRGKGSPVSAIDLDPDGNIPTANARDLNQTPNELAYLQYIRQQFDVTSSCRWGLEIDWQLSLAFYESRQWLVRSLAGTEIASLINSDERTRYMTINRIKTLCDKVEAIATQSSPDVQFMPLTSKKEDEAAAKTAGAIHAHYSQVYDRPLQTKNRVNVI